MMSKKLKSGAQRIAASPAVRRSASSIKPTKSVWGFLGVVLFFIVPEIVAFVWGEGITSFAQHKMISMPAQPYETWYELLAMLFEDGGSWINLTIGIALLIWLFF